MIRLSAGHNVVVARLGRHVIIIVLPLDSYRPVVGATFRSRSQILIEEAFC